MSAPINFLCDPRVQLLSAQEESFLNRLFEARARNELTQYGGHFPTDPKLLRPIAYPHKPGPRDSFLQCLIAKLEQVRIATMIPPAPCAVFDLPPYLPIQCAEIPESEPAPVRHGLIHIHGPDPPLNRNEIIAAAAATAVSSSDLIEKLKTFFPRHDLVDEWRRYKIRRKKDGQPAVAISKNARCLSFVKWMENADVPLRSVAKFDAINPMAGQAELNFTEPATPRFMAEFESRKLRRATG